LVGLDVEDQAVWFTAILHIATPVENVRCLLELNHDFRATLPKAFATKSLYEINQKFKVDMPILDTVYQIIYAHKIPAPEIKRLAEKLT